MLEIAEQTVYTIQFAPELYRHILFGTHVLLSFKKLKKSLTQN